MAVGQRFLVYWTRDLYLVGASVMPVITRGNTSLPY
ncbi:choline dehydrogenase-like flavoprotein [Paraburkholderia strydomiana]|nr:choline dehydrogenase-like flavoprotein [Paraburkholderia strydomiana]